MNYLAYHFEVKPPQPGSEILMALISEWPFDSFEAHENGFSAFVKEEESEIIDLSKLIFDDFTFTFNIEKIITTNWNEEWEKNFEPVVVENLLCIRAPFHPKDNTVKHEIVIMPKMSFGTGHHQTTRLMCTELFNDNLAGNRLLDMGCGTGILAILASKLGAKEIIGIDIDEWSVENAIENCAANNCTNISIKKGDVDLLETEGQFDIILANINKNILKKQLPYYSKVCKPKGGLYLSGFFTTDVEELIKVAESCSFKYLLSRNENEWAMMKLIRN